MSKRKAPRLVTPPRVRNAAYDQVADRGRNQRITAIERAGLDEAKVYLEQNDISGALAVLRITASWVARYKNGAPGQVGVVN